MRVASADRVGSGWKVDCNAHLLEIFQNCFLDSHLLEIDARRIDDIGNNLRVDGANGLVRHDGWKAAALAEVLVGRDCLLDQRPDLLACVPRLVVRDSRSDVPLFYTLCALSFPYLLRADKAMRGVVMTTADLGLRDVASQRLQGAAKVDGFVKWRNLAMRLRCREGSVKLLEACRRSVYRCLQIQPSSR